MSTTTTLEHYLATMTSPGREATPSTHLERGAAHARHERHVDHDVGSGLRRAHRYPWTAYSWLHADMVGLGQVKSVD